MAGASPPDDHGDSDDRPAGQPDDLDVAIARLYGGPPGEFVAARKALAGSLRAAGRRDDAAAVAKLRKPSRAAWALDAAALADPATVAALVEAAGAMVSAQEGGGDSDVRSAMSDLRDAVRALSVAAAEAAATGGHPVPAAELGPPVLAVVGNPDGLAALRAGRLVEIPEGGGFGLGTGTGPQPGRPAGRPAPSVRATSASRAPEARRGPGRAAERRVERAEAAVAAARDATAAAGTALEEAESELSRAEAVAEAATARAREAEQRARAAQQAAREANEQRVAADRARIAADRDRDRARHRLDDARHRLHEADQALTAARDDAPSS